MLQSGSVFQNDTSAYRGVKSQPAAVCDSLCIIGDGLPSLAIASLVAAAKIGIIGFDTSEIPSVSQFEIRERGASVCAYRGAIEGIVLDRSDCQSEISQAEGILVCASSTRYGEIAHFLVPALTDGQTICLVDAPLGAALQFRHELESADCEAQISILELGSLYDRLKVESGVLLISGLRKRITSSSIERNELRRGLKIAQSLGCEIVPSSNLVERGFTDIERLIRPPAMLAALFSANSDSFSVGFGSEALFRLIDSIEKEVQGIARSYGSIAPEFSRSICEIALGGEVVVAQSDSNLASLLDRFGTRLMAIEAIDQESCVDLLKEDVEEVYTLLSDLGAKSRSTVGTIDSIIDLACAISGSDLRSLGRNLESLGLVGFDTREIIDLVNS